MWREFYLDNYFLEFFYSANVVYRRFTDISTLFYDSASVIRQSKQNSTLALLFFYSAESIFVTAGSANVSWYCKNSREKWLVHSSASRRLIARFAPLQISAHPDSSQMCARVCILFGQRYEPCLKILEVYALVKSVFIDLSGFSSLLCVRVVKWSSFGKWFFVCFFLFSSSKRLITHFSLSIGWTYSAMEMLPQLPVRSNCSV